MKHLFGFLCLALMLTFTACHDDIDEAGQSSTQLPTPKVTKIFDGNILGRVVTESGMPAVGAFATYEGNTAVADEQGVFSFQNVNMSSGGAYVKVSYDGYFHASTRVYPRSNNHIELAEFVLMPLTITGSVSASTGGQIDLPEGGTVVLPANGFVQANGQPYTGQVNVAARWLNPTDTELGDLMPGSLEAMDSNGENVALATYGMMAVELLDASGASLQLAEGSPAELRMPVPSTILSSAPSEIPLWYFDEQDGIWREEGAATLQGDTYVGEVAHFSFWNCDAPFPLVELTGCVVDEDEEPLQGVRVLIERSNSPTRGGFTNSEGVFGGKIPKNESLVLKLLDRCGNVVYSETIGPFADNVELPCIVIDNSPNLMNVTGTAVDCNDDPVSNGYAVFTINNRQIILPLENDGTFSLSLLICNATTFELYVVDADAAKKSDPISLTVSADVAVGTLKACDQVLTEFITVDVDGDVSNFIEPFPQAFIERGRGAADSFLVVNAWQDSIMNFGFSIPAYTGVGSYDAMDIAEFYHSIEDGPNPYRSTCPNFCPFDSFEITLDEGSGGYLEGNFSGNLDYFFTNSQSTMTVPVSGSFRILIE